MSARIHPLNEANLESYHDDPTMSSSAQYDDSRSPALHSPPAFASPVDAARPPLLNIRSSVPLLPTPGTVSKRHPNFVRLPFSLPIEF